MKKANWNRLPTSKLEPELPNRHHKMAVCQRYWRLTPSTTHTYCLAEAQGSPLLDDCAFAVVDVETTGMRAIGSDRITEIAVVVVHGGRREVVFESLVNPGRPIPPADLRHHQHHRRDGARRARPSPRLADQVLAAWRGASSSPTMRASTGTSSAPRCGARGTWRWTGRGSAPCGWRAGW